MRWGTEGTFQTTLPTAWGIQWRDVFHCRFSDRQLLKTQFVEPFEEKRVEIGLCL